MTLSLCDRHGALLPGRTHGWISAQQPSPQVAAYAVTLHVHGGVQLKNQCRKRKGQDLLTSPALLVLVSHRTFHVDLAVCNGALARWCLRLVHLSRAAAAAAQLYMQLDSDIPHTDRLTHFPARWSSHWHLRRSQSLTTRFPSVKSLQTTCWRSSGPDKRALQLHASSHTVCSALWSRATLN